MWLIDHGLCFHVDEKLRTVIWDFVGEPIPEDLCADLGALRHKLESVGGAPSELAMDLLDHLSAAEVKTLDLRADQLIAAGRFPPPDPHRRPFPWPQI